MASALTDPRSGTAERGTRADPGSETPAPTTAPEQPEDVTELLEPVGTELLSDLDHPDLVLSDGYIGPERRAGGRLARLRRATFSQRRSLLTLEFIVVITVAVVVAAVLVTGSGSRPGGTRLTAARHTAAGARGSVPATPVAPPATSPPTSLAPPVATTPPAAAAPPAAPPAAAPPATTPAPATAGSLTPAQLGAEALTMVRYPWQQLPGYSIQFLPISEAPSPSFYGNTTFTWGHTGGTSVLYVYPGETAQRLAGITAFEIAHEVDAASVEPAGGQAQIEDILNYHPASWAPNCDCAEQGFLSGWYAAAFSNYWSPGVGNWSQLPVAAPSGATLGEVASWLNPPIP